MRLRTSSAVLSCLLLAGCGSPDRHEGPSVGTNSNWLRACADDGECGELTACACGACTMPCTSDAECNDLAGARCVQRGAPAGLASCGGEEPAMTEGLCLPTCTPGACHDGQACVDGACVLASLPDNAFCNPVATRDVAMRAREEELLALLDELRTAGVTTCGGTLGAAARPPLRLDPRLTCAARVLADDLRQRGGTSLVDAQGRSTMERLSAAGYAGRLWGEAFAVDAASAAAARDLIAGDPASCMGVLQSTFGDVGIGNAGAVFVVTLGAQ